MTKNVQNHNQIHFCGVKSGKLTSKSFIGVAFSLMLLLLISCSTNVQESQNTVSVSGIGSVLAQPDMVQINIYFSHTAPTTKDAKKALDETMQRISKILREENIEDKSIKTVSLNYDVEYDYRSGRRVWVGQRAQQTISVTINDIIKTPERFSSILDKITAIDRIEVQNIQFDIENKGELFKQSRELAYQKALEKASQYAALSGSKIGKVLSISEGVSRDVAQTRMLQNISLQKEAVAFSADSFVPAGEQGVTTEINVVFSLK